VLYLSNSAVDRQNKRCYNKDLDQEVILLSKASS